MLKTITVGDLIDLLQGYDDDMPVVFASNYGDRARTQQAHALLGNAEEVTLRESGYSDSGYAVVEDEDEADDDIEFLLIS